MMATFRHWQFVYSKLFSDYVHVLYPYAAWPDSPDSQKFVCGLLHPVYRTWPGAGQKSAGFWKKIRKGSSCHYSSSSSSSME